MRKYLTESQKEYIATSYTSGVPATKIASEMSIGETTVYRIIEQKGAKAPHVKGNRYKLSIEQEQQVLEYHAKKYFAKTIGKIFGVTSQTIVGIIRRNGLKPHDKFRRANDEDIKIMLELCEDGQSIEFIKKELSHRYTRRNISIILKKAGLNPGVGAAKRERHAFWKGGFTILAGYKYINLESSDPFICMVNGGGYVAEHRLEMARYLDRPLLDNESVHHIDGDKLNNNIENLQLRVGKHGKGEAYCCLDCGSRKIGPIPLD